MAGPFIVSEKKIMDWYLQKIANFPLLSKKQERQFLISYKTTGNRQAFQALVNSNLRFVVSVALNYKNIATPLPDLINEGNLGLLKAIERYKIEKFEIKFISYAVWWIRQSIILAIHDKGRLIRLTSFKENLLVKIQKTVDQSLYKYGFINYGFIELHCQCKREDVDFYIQQSENYWTLNGSGGKGTEFFFESIPNLTIECPHRKIEEHQRRQIIKGFINELPYTEKLVIRYHFGIDVGHNFNLEQIGKVIGVCRERVRQIRNKALKKLKEKFELNFKNTSILEFIDN